MIPTPPPNPCGLSDSGIDIISRCVIVCFCETTYWELFPNIVIRGLGKFDTYIFCITDAISRDDN